MKNLIKLLLLMTLTTNSIAQNTFKQYQLAFDRVKEAYDQKWTSLQTDLTKRGFRPNFQLFITAYKNEGKLELWLKSDGQPKYQLFKTYEFCAHSGTLGPKVVEGDGQTPEGFYYINAFNPLSNFHLSLGLDYPNKVDLARTGNSNKPGYDIYIHGNCVTIGCIPLTDEKIKEVYIIAVEARNAGQKKIPVSIFPFRMNEANMKKYTAQFPLQTTFWETLQQGYQQFEQKKTLPKVKQIKGTYLVK
jgi:murein L,D-transpeptidase YafK